MKSIKPVGDSGQLQASWGAGRYTLSPRYKVLEKVQEILGEDIQTWLFGIQAKQRETGKPFIPSVKLVVDLALAVVTHKAGKDEAPTTDELADDVVVEGPLEVFQGISYFFSRIVAGRERWAEIDERFTNLSAEAAKALEADAPGKLDPG